MGFGRAGASADGGQKRDLIAIGERMGGGDVLAVDGDRDGGPEGSVVGMEGAAAVEEVADGRSGGEIERARRAAGKVAKRAEGEECDAHEEIIIRQSAGSAASYIDETGFSHWTTEGRERSFAGLRDRAWEPDTNARQWN